MTPFNRERFEALIDAYGAHPSRWPQVDRSAMQDLVATEPWAAAAVAQADPLDAWLDAAPILGDADRIRGTIIEQAPKALAAQRFKKWIGALGIGAVLAAAGASGVAVGAVFAPSAVISINGVDRDALGDASSWLQTFDDGGSVDTSQAESRGTLLGNS